MCATRVRKTGVSKTPPAAVARARNASQTTTGSGTVKLDLVVVIDTSPSMGEEAGSLSKVVDTALKAARINCPCAARITYLGIQGTWPETRFDQSAKDYLLAHGAKAGDLQARDTANGLFRYGNQEDLARAVIDVSKYFDWQVGAKRAVFVLGNAGLDGGGGVRTDSALEKRKEAVGTATANGVKVYAYQGTKAPSNDPLDTFPTVTDLNNVTKEYRHLAEDTGGTAYIYTAGIARFELMLEQILCDALIPVDRHGGQRDAAPGSGRPGGDCGNVCVSFEAVVHAIGMLACVLDKAIDACCASSSCNGALMPAGPRTSAGRKGPASDCCHGDRH